MDTIKRILLALLTLMMLVAFTACDDDDEPSVAQIFITSHVTETEVTVTAVADGEVALFINGQPVDNPYIATRGSETYSASVYATAKDGDRPMLRSEVYTVQVPAVQAGDQPEVFSVNGVMFRLVLVNGGTFMMGSGEQADDVADDEMPAHQVTLSDYAIGQTQVTQELWQTVMGTNPSHFSDRYYYKDNLQRPVECVSWDDCQAFISVLNHITGMAFRLPTEAEWEFAARGGNNSQGFIYAGGNIVDDVAWYAVNNTQAVATRAANELGLYDMSGNVWEWCYDWKGGYSSEAQTNPTGPSSGTNRVMRGGSWSSDAASCRVPNRNSTSPSNKGENLGLRLAL